MDHRRDIRFLLNDREVTLAHVAAETMLLDFLRLDQRLPGTKEGCAEGDCGACTVLIGQLESGLLRYAPVNACIRFLATVDGCHVVTVEHLANAEGGLHPVQQAMIAEHGSQCGFCTPGIVMSLAALWMAADDPTLDEVDTALQGNLCRCTGYAPIRRAAIAASRRGLPADDRLSRDRQAIAARLTALRTGGRVELHHGESRATLPADTDDLARLLAETPQATIVAGGTDAGLWVTKGLRQISPAVFIGHLDGLREVRAGTDALTIGACATYTQAAPVLCATFPHLTDYWARIGGWQVRNAGTIGGNIANGSPIGDTPPALIALGAEVILRRADDRRSLPLEDFFLAYGQQDRAPDEFIEEIRVPRPAPDSRHAAYKVSKRRDEDISSVVAAFNVTVADGQITAARIAFGGMAALPTRACQAEDALIGQPWAEASLGAAAARLPDDLSPISDMRASADYRMRVAQNLFLRFYREQTQGADAVRLGPA